MNCLLAAATANEIAPLITYYRNGGNKQDIDILITGIGLTAAAYSLTKQINIKKPGIIIQAGIAGCFDKNLSLGSVVVITQDTIADQGVIENNQLKTMFDLGLIKSGQPPFNKNWLVNSNKDLIKQTGLKAVKAISVNQVTTNRQMAELYHRKFRPVVETMEGAALHYVCGMEKIPFLQIRAISNYIGERDKKKWNIKEAIINLNRQITNLTSTLNP